MTLTPLIASRKSGLLHCPMNGQALKTWRLTPSGGESVVNALGHTIDVVCSRNNTHPDRVGRFPYVRLTRGISAKVSAAAEGCCGPLVHRSDLSTERPAQYCQHPKGTLIHITVQTSYNLSENCHESQERHKAGRLGRSVFDRPCIAPQR